MEESGNEFANRIERETMPTEAELIGLILERSEAIARIRSLSLTAQQVTAGFRRLSEMMQQMQR